MGVFFVFNLEYDVVINAGYVSFFLGLGTKMGSKKKEHFLFSVGAIEMNNFGGAIETEDKCLCVGCRWFFTQHFSCLLSVLAAEVFAISFVPFANTKVKQIYIFIHIFYFISFCLFFFVIIFFKTFM